MVARGIRRPAKGPSENLHTPLSDHLLQTYIVLIALHTFLRQESHQTAPALLLLSSKTLLSNDGTTTKGRQCVSPLAVLVTAAMEGTSKNMPTCKKCNL